METYKEKLIALLSEMPFDSEMTEVLIGGYENVSEEKCREIYESLQGALKDGERVLKLIRDAEERYKKPTD